jgi:filamentous hemagglutinin family protein
MPMTRVPARPRGAPRNPARALALLGSSLLALGLGEARAQAPVGGVVARGAASIAQTAARTTIRQRSQRAVIDWRGFDVGRRHQVVFAQPGRDAATLNRVDSVRPSVIQGSVRAPGTVIIQNTAGVIFTGSAKVDTGGLVATSQAVDAARFERDGGLTIGGGERPGARVVNHGTITVGEAGLAALVGGDVENAGAIVARRGTVALASGTRSTIDLSGDGLVRIAVDGNGVGVRNSGLIDAGDGRVLLTAGDAARALDGAINTSGIIRATSGTGDGGRIELVGRGSGKIRVAGTLDASGRSRGGTVAVTGAEVEVGAARLAASGAKGGAVRLGGGRQGKGPLRRAERTSIARSAVISAGGRGGSVIAWSDGTTVVDGTISAGPAGFVETSGLVALGIGETAAVDVGPGGAWLLDPRDVVITSGSAANPPSGTVSPPPGTSAFTISRNAVAAALNAGTDVTITTVQPASHMAGDITLAGPLSWTGAGDLTLRAERGIVLNGPVTTRTGDFTADAARDVTVNADLRATGTAAVGLTAAAGDVNITRQTSGSLVVSTDTGALTLKAPRGRVFVRRLGGGRGNIQVYSNSGDLTITAGQKIYLRGEADDGSWVRVGSEDSSSDVTLTSPWIKVWGGEGNNSFGELVTGAGGSLTMDADEIFVESNASEGRVAALGGAALTMRAARQIWDGPVRAGSGGSDGGDVLLAGTIDATVRPLFSLAPGADFTLAAATPGGAPSAYRSALPLTVSTTGTGAIAIGAPVRAEQVSLLSQERVTFGAGAQVTGTGSGDAVVVAAGRAFVNLAGSGVVAAPDGRWLVYIDRFDGLTGTAPGPREFDLYGRPFAANPPQTLGFGGNRIVWGERPTLTFTAGSLRKGYGTVASLGYTLTGLRPGDDLATALATGPNVTSPGAAAGAGVGSYPTRVAATASAQGYAVAFVNGTLTVDPAVLTVTANDAARRYGAANPTFGSRIEGFVLGDGAEILDGDVTLTTSATRASPVGDYAIRPSGLTVLDGNYTIAYVDGTLSVDPAPLTVTANDAGRTYGAANPGFTARYSGFVLGEDASDLGGGLHFVTGATQRSDVGQYAVTPLGLTGGNYAITYRPGTLTVDPAPLTVTANDASRAYGAANPNFTARYSGFVLGEDAGDLGGALRFTTAARAASPVGTYAVTPSGLTSANYRIAFADGTLTVGRATLVVTANDAARTYGGEDPAFGARYTGFVLGDDAGDLGGALRFATSATRQSDVGRYAITADGLTSENYAITYRPGTLTVNPAPLTVTADDARRTYGAADPAFAARYAGFVLGDDAGDLDGDLRFATDATRSSDVGRYALTPAGLSSGNYAISYRAGTLTVDPAPLTVTANNAGRTYGAANPDFTARYAGFVLGEDAGDLDGALRFVTDATRSSDVGRYAVTPAGLGSGNYAISYRPGTLNVDPAQLTVTAGDASRTYGAANPDFTARYAGFVLGQDAGDLDGDLRFVTNATRSSDVGRYGVTPTGLSSGNYAISYRAGTLNVDPAQLTVTAGDASRTYGAANPDFTARYAGFVLGQDAGDLDGDLRFVTNATRSSDVGRYAVTPAGLSSGNYAISYRGGTLSVDPARLTVTANDATRAVGEADPDFGATIDGFVLGHDIDDLDGALDFVTSAHGGSPAGIYTVTPGGLASGNYAIDFVAGRFTVTPQPGEPVNPPDPRLSSGFGGADPFRRGVPPLTPGDASFRTTVAEAPPALANPFDLTYSLGEIVQLAPQGADTQGFVPAAGGLPESGDCRGTVNRGSEGCGRQRVAESYWATVEDGR